MIEEDNFLKDMFHTLDNDGSLDISGEYRKVKDRDPRITNPSLSVYWTEGECICIRQYEDAKKYNLPRYWSFNEREENL
jgi:hypothetical protein